MAPAAAELAPEAPPAGAASTARTARRRQVSSHNLDGESLCPRSHIQCGSLLNPPQMLRLPL